MANSVSQEKTWSREKKMAQWRIQYHKTQAREKKMAKWQIQYHKRKKLGPEKRKWRNGEFSMTEVKKLRRGEMVFTMDNDAPEFVIFFEKSDVFCILGDIEL